MDMSGEGQGHLSRRRWSLEVKCNGKWLRRTTDSADVFETDDSLMPHWWLNEFIYVYLTYTYNYIHIPMPMFVIVCVCVCFQCFSPRVVPLSLIRCLPHFLHVFSRFSFHNSSTLQALGFGLLVWIVPWSIPVLFPMRGWHQMVYKMHSLYFVWSYSYSIKVSSIIFNNWINMNQWYSMISNDL